ncbi:MAG: hypothetical protein AAF865_15965, partial [Pseudomonadota bacterium]
GKSMTGRAILRLIRPPGEVQARHIALEGVNLLDLPKKAMRAVRGQVLSVIDRLVEERGMGLIFISHDLNLVAHFCDRMLIMYAGRVVETCPVEELHAAQHPYTHHLLESALRFVRNG